MSPAEVRLRDRLLSCTALGTFGLGLKSLSKLTGVRAFLHLEGASVPPLRREREYLSAALSFSAQADSTRMVLGIDPSLASHLINAALGRAARPDRPSSMETLSQGEVGALLYALDCAGKDWLDAAEGKFKLRGFLADMAQIPEYLGRPPEIEVRGTICLDDRAFEIRLFCLKDSVATDGKRTRPFTPALSWRVRIALCLGWTALSRSDAAGLGLGDKVVLDGYCTPQKTGGAASPVLMSGAWHRYGRFVSESAVEIMSAVETEKTMSADRGDIMSYPLTADTGAGDAGDMNVQVRIEVGSLNLSVQQALDLVPGKVIRLDRPVGPDVRVVVGDKLLGTGTLVDVDGFMAVEIKEVVR